MDDIFDVSFPDLTEEQRQVARELYTRFRRIDYTTDLHNFVAALRSFIEVDKIPASIDLHFRIPNRCVGMKVYCGYEGKSRHEFGNN